MIGPPNEPLASYDWMMPGVCVRPIARRSSVRLLPRDQLPAPLTNAVPAKRLPPDFGTRFITGPPMSLSPSPAPTVIATSSELAVSYTYDDTPPLLAAAIVMPLTVIRPSPATPAAFALLECALKNVIVGDNAGPLVSTVSPGVALSSAPTARATGSVWMTLWFMTISRLAFCTSTSGVSPVTVTVSAIAPTRISIGIVTVWVPEIWMFSRRTVVNPLSVNVSAYVPGCRSMIRYWPDPSVVAERVFSMSAGLAASTTTPGSTAPDGS